MILKKNLLVIAAGLTAVLLSDYASADQRSVPDKFNFVLGKIACHSMGRFDDCRLNSFETDDLADDVQRIQYHFQVGPGEYDTITVHRILSDESERQRKAMMLLPGTGLNVETLYLPRSVTNAVADDYSPLIHLAAEGIDAWSADYRGSDLPSDITDFSFMADWGLATATSDMQLAIRFARLIRLFSGNGYDRLIVGGYSAGVPVAFAVASADAARHYGRRDIGGLVAVDFDFELDPANTAAVETACDDLAFYDSLIADGIFNDDQGFLIYVGNLAKNFPDDPSPIAAMIGFDPATTNLQLLNIFVVLPSPGDPFHVFGGTFDETGFPVPVFTPQALIVAQASSFVPSLPVQFSREIAMVRCSVEPVSELDGGLVNITVPVFHIGAVGGSANAIDYTLSILGSDDITSTLVQVLDPGQEGFDYGHGDMFGATDADVRVWQPIADWVASRSRSDDDSDDEDDDDDGDDEDDDEDGDDED